MWKSHASIGHEFFSLLSESLTVNFDSSCTHSHRPQFIRSPWAADQHRSQSHDNKRNKRSYFHPNWLQLNVTGNKKKSTEKSNVWNLHIRDHAADCSEFHIQIFGILHMCNNTARPLFLSSTAREVHYLNNIISQICLFYIRAHECSTPLSAVLCVSFLSPLNDWTMDYISRCCMVDWELSSIARANALECPYAHLCIIISYVLLAHHEVLSSCRPSDSSMEMSKKRKERNRKRRFWSC